MRSISTLMTTPFRQERVIAVMWMASMVLWLATWNALHWSWGYAIFTFGVAFLTRWFQSQLSSSQFGFLVPLLIIIVGNQVSTSLFYPGPYPTAGQIHHGAAFGVMLASAIALADRLKRSRDGRKGSVEPPPVIRDDRLSANPRT